MLIAFNADPTRVRLDRLFDNSLDQYGVFDGSMAPSAPAACGVGDTEAAATRRCVLGFASVDALKRWVRAHPGRAGVGPLERRREPPNK